MSGSHSPEDNPFAHFADPIDVAAHGSYLAPHLQQPALLELGNEPILIVPEIEPVVPELQDYKLIAVRSVARRMNLSDEDGAALLNHFRTVDHAFEAEMGVLPVGVAIIRHGEEVTIGRTNMPQLELGKQVEKVHAIVEAMSKGLRISDLESNNGTVLHLSRKDAESPLTPVETETIDEKLRDELLQAFGRLMTGRDLEIERDGLHIDACYVEHDDSGFNSLELLILEADEYPNIKPAEGDRLTMVRLSPTKPGAVIHFLADSTRQRAPGINKANVKSELTVRQAKELMRIALSV